MQGQFASAKKILLMSSIEQGDKTGSVKMPKKGQSVETLKSFIFHSKHSNTCAEKTKLVSLGYSSCKII